MASFSRKGILIKTIEMALELWIKKQCNSIKKIKLELDGSFFDLLSGKLGGVKVLAKEVDFKCLLFTKVDLETGPLKVRLEKQKLNFNQNFEIKGSISFTNEDLQNTIFSREWNWISKWLADKLLDAKEIKALLINENKIELIGINEEANSVSGIYKIESFLGSIIIREEGNSRSCLIPMDQNICIESACIKNKKVLLSGHSKIKT